MKKKLNFRYFCTYFLFFILSKVHAQDFDTVMKIDSLAETELVDHKPLMANRPEGSRVFRSRTDDRFGVTELTFMNGVQILLKPTDFKDDQILFSGFSPGGSSLYLNEDYMSAIMSPNIVAMSGLGDFDYASLSKILADNTARLSPYISEIHEGVTGMAAPDDLETLLQLNYLYFTATRHDEDAFNTLISQLRSQAENMRANPVYAFIDTLNKVITSNNPRTVTIPAEAQINRIRHDHALHIFNGRFSCAGDFKFVMVGNFDVNTITPLLEAYLGGLPSRRRVETWRDVTPHFPAGITTFNFYRNSEEQSRVNISMRGVFRWNIRERISFEMFTRILQINLSEELYELNVSGSVWRHPRPQYSLDITWMCSPEDVDNLVYTLFDEARRLKTRVPSAADLNKVKETLIREREIAIKENSFWLQELLNTYMQGDRLMTLEEYTRLVNSVRPNDIRRAARQYFNETNYVIGKLMPAL